MPRADSPPRRGAAPQNYVLAFGKGDRESRLRRSSRLFGAAAGGSDGSDAVGVVHQHHDIFREVFVVAAGDLNCVATYLELGGGAAEEFAALRARFKKPEAEMKPITWEEKVEARGLEKGREQGRERGKEDGMREVLLRLLRNRFPSLTGRTVERVEAIRSPEELGSLAERLLTARSLEELGLA